MKDTNSSSLGSILLKGFKVPGGCCPIGPSYACHRCGRPAKDRTTAAKETTLRMYYQYEK